MELVKNNEPATRAGEPWETIFFTSSVAAPGTWPTLPGSPPPRRTCDGLGLRGDGPGGGLCLGGRHRFLGNELDGAGRRPGRAGQLAATLLVCYKGVQVVKLLLAEATDMDVGGQLDQHRCAPRNSMGQRESDRLIPNSVKLQYKPNPCRKTGHGGRHG